MMLPLSETATNASVLATIVATEKVFASSGDRMRLSSVIFSIVLFLQPHETIEPSFLRAAKQPNPAYTSLISVRRFCGISDVSSP